jgi:2-phosphosulfolactate phosphatase
MNRAAVAGWLRDQAGDALLICSGYEGIFSLEDAVCAGAIVDRARQLAKGLTLGDGARACQVLWQRYGSDLVALFRGTAWGQRMLALGFEADLAVCAELDATGVVPQMEGERITLNRPTTA